LVFRIGSEDSFADYRVQHFMALPVGKTAQNNVAGYRFRATAPRSER
jgi:hypothetical protein